MRTGTLITTLLTAILAAPAAAQRDGDPNRESAADTVQLEELVVTATRVPLHRAALPTPVAVWTGAELRASGIRTVADALRHVPSAIVARAGPQGAQTSLFLRGAESNYVKVLVDGITVNDPGGSVDLADLSTDQVERIEVVRGPVSVLYGSDAVAGVVQVFTRRGTSEPAWSVTATGGRGSQRHADGGYGVAEADATVSGRAGPIRYTAGGGHSWNEGVYPFNSGRSMTDGTVRLGWTPAAPVEIAVVSRLSDSESGFPTDGAGALVDRNARLERRLATTAIQGGWRLGPTVDAQLRVGLADRRQASVDPPDGPGDTLGVYSSRLDWDVSRRTIEARVDVALESAVLTGGIALERAEADIAYDSRSEWGPLTAGAGYRRTNRGYYVQILAEPLGGVDLTLGGRIDDNQTFGSFATYRAGVSLEPVPGTRLRAAIGRGFREPSFDENFGSGFGDVGNPRLEPERSLSLELGIEQRLAGGFRVQLTGFDQRFEDLIQFTFAPDGPDQPNYFNVGAARSRGVELEGAYERGAVRFGASYAWLDTEVLDPGLATDAAFVEGEPLLRRPRHSGTLSGRYAVGGGSLGLTLNAVGERHDLDFAAGFPAPRVTLPAYATLDLAAEHRIPVPAALRADLLLRLDNLLDERYSAIRGFPAPGRVVRLGIRLGSGGP